jgi:cytochrome c biogenesis protein CcmG/thiol:disulfide interchange protein DsbE
VKRVIVIGVAVAILALGAVLVRAVVNSSDARGFPAQAAAGELPTAPAFDLETLDGTGSVSSADLRGSVAVVNFWASWCDPCKDEAPLIEDLWRTEGEPNGVVFLGIDTQDLREDAREFAQTYGLTYPLVYDEGGAVGRAWGVGAFPETFVLDREGRAVAWFPGVVTAEGLREAIAKAEASG